MPCNPFRMTPKDVVVFTHHHPELGKIDYEGKFIGVQNGFLLVKIFKMNRKDKWKDISTNGSIAKFYLTQIKFENLLDVSPDIGLQIAQAIHNAEKTRAVPAATKQTAAVA